MQAVKVLNGMNSMNIATRLSNLAYPKVSRDEGENNKKVSTSKNSKIDRDEYKECMEHCVVRIEKEGVVLGTGVIISSEGAVATAKIALDGGACSRSLVE